ncbi:hypothetical protein, partial [Pseudomonas sp. FME51]|uniref:hypothetical protein n=1 Tax=Pseudomonas sp. FME51 TaxID=2742609 RepID=UPI001D00A4D3
TGGHVETEWVVTMARNTQDARGAASHQFSQQVLRPFRRAPLHAFGQIEFFLHGLAASVLENLFGQAFGKLEQEETKSFAREHIRGFFRRSSFECGVFDDLVEEMSSLVYQVAVEWSCRIRPHIKGKLLQPKVMIMPGYVRRGYLCIAMMLWGKEREEQSLMIEEHSGMGNQEVCWFECEADIPDEVRVQAGLIQRDKVKNE